MDDIATLKQVPLFSQMDETEIAGVRAIMQEDVYAPGQVIMRQGDKGDLFCVITKGHVQFLVQDVTGQEIVVDEVGPGGFFGELSMLTGEPRAARVKSLDEVTTLGLDRNEFFTFLQQHPPASIDVLTVLSQRLHRVDSLLQKSASRNVNEIVDDKLTIGQRIADVIADFSGSIPFLIINALFFTVWIAWNQPWMGGLEFDPYPFGLLTMIVSLEAIFLSIFLLISSNRQAAKDRIAAEVDHQVNTKAEIEIGLVLQRLDDLEQSMPHQVIQALTAHQMLRTNRATHAGVISQEQTSNDRST